MLDTDTLPSSRSPAATPPGDDTDFSVCSATVRRGSRAILDDVSCAFRRRRLTAILGPNGAGKSTLLRVLSSELKPDSGAVSLDGRPLAAWTAPELARRRSVLPQESLLSFPFRVSEVVLLGRMPHSPAGEKPRDHAIVREALARVDMLHAGDRIYTTLSGGEKQRVHLARALAQIWEEPPPPVKGRKSEGRNVETLDLGRPGPARTLLLDEPTSNLDPAHQHATLGLARRLADDGVTVVAILHDLNLALAYADDVLLIRGGRVAAAGPTRATLTPGLIRDVFNVDARLIEPPGCPPHFILGPHAALVTKT